MCYLYVCSDNVIILTTVVSKKITKEPHDKYRIVFSGTFSLLVKGITKPY